jgi:hypothetical protein
MSSAMRDFSITRFGEMPSFEELVSGVMKIHVFETNVMIGYQLRPGHVLCQTFQVSKTWKVFVPPKTDSLTIRVSP